MDIAVKYIKAANKALHRAGTLDPWGQGRSGVPGAARRLSWIWGIRRGCLPSGSEGRNRINHRILRHMQTLITTAAGRTISSHIQQEENLGWANQRNPVARRRINTYWSRLIGISLARLTSNQRNSKQPLQNNWQQATLDSGPEASVMG